MRMGLLFIVPRLIKHLANVNFLIIEQSATIVPVANHDASFACLNKLHESTFKKLPTALVALNVVNSYPLIERME